MTLLSPSFMFMFLPVALTVYALTPGHRRSYMLPLLGGLFCAAVNINNPATLVVIPLIITAVVISVELYRKKRIVIGLAICRTASIIAIFTVLVFRIVTQNSLLSGVGLVFCLMTATSICSDVLRGDGRIPDTPWDTVIYMTFFPVVFVGPFIKYGDFVGKIDRLDFSIENFTCASVGYISGVIKCVAVSAVLGEAYNRLLIVLGRDVSLITAVILMIMYGLRIYYFLSGYSQMACGLAAMFGIRVGRDCRGGFFSVTPCECIRSFLSSLLDFCRSYITIPVSDIVSGVSGSVVAAVFAAFFYALLFASNMETVYSVMIILAAIMLLIVRRTGKKRGHVSFVIRILGGAVTFLVTSAVLWYIELGGPDNTARVLDAVLSNRIFSIPTYAPSVLGDAKYILLPLICGTGCKLISLLFKRDNEYLNARQSLPVGETIPLTQDGNVKTALKYIAALFLIVAFVFVVIILLPQYPELASVRSFFPFI